MRIILKKPKREVNKARFTLIFILGFELLCIYLCYALLTFYAIEDWSIFLQDIKNSNILLNGILGSILLLGICLPVFLAYYRYKVLRNERLTLDENSIHYNSNIPKFLQGLIKTTFSKDWSLKWSDITLIYLKSTNDTYKSFFIMICFHAGLHYYELFPYQWVTTDNEQYPKKLSGDLSNQEKFKTYLHQYYFFKYIADKEIEISPRLLLNPNSSVRT